MARPRKNNAEYFSHDNDMRNNKKILAVRSKFGIEGYSTYCMLLETLCGSDFFRIKNDEVTLLLISGDFRIDIDKLKTMIDFFISIDLLQIDSNNNILCKQLLDRLQYLLSKREEERLKYSKVKYSKVKEIRRNQQKSAETPISDTETKPKGFIKPTIEQIKEYCNERNNTIDAGRFFDYYEVRGWKPKGSNVQMKDWRAAVRTWERGEYNKNEIQTTENERKLIKGFLLLNGWQKDKLKQLDITKDKYTLSLLEPAKKVLSIFKNDLDIAYSKLKSYKENLKDGKDFSLHLFSIKVFERYGGRDG